MCSFKRSFVDDVHKEQRGVRSREHKRLVNFTNGPAWVLGKGVFFPYVNISYIYVAV